MKKLVPSLVLSVLSISANAADLPGRGVTGETASVPMWTGFYIGIHGGGARSVGGSSFTPLPNVGGWDRSPETFNLDKTGAVFGGHLGYNHQIASSFLAGIELDWSQSNLSRSVSVAGRDSSGTQFSPVSPEVMSRDAHRLSSMRLRLGFLPASDLLAYLTAGPAMASYRFSATLSSVAPGTDWPTSNKLNKSGWVFGGGAEWKLNLSFSLRAEYLQYSFNGLTRTAVGVPNNFPAYTIRYDWDRNSIRVARVGISYLFGNASLPAPSR